MPQDLLFPAYAGKETPSPKKDFLKIVGSNFCLRDTSFLFSYNYPFSLLAKTDISVEWRRLCDEIRNHFAV